MRRAAKHDSGFHFNRVSISQVRLELPLTEGIGDGFCLIGKGAEKVDVFYSACLIDDDTDWNRIGPTLGEDGINPGKHVFLARVILYAYWEGASARSGCRTGLCGQCHLVEIKKQTGQQFSITAGNTISTAWQRIWVATTCQWIWLGLRLSKFCSTVLAAR
jgi:hypothetical protein